MNRNKNKSGRPSKNKKIPFTSIFRELVGVSTQQEIADKIGTSRQNVGKWLSGTTSPDITALGKIANAYNVSTDYLLGRTPNKTVDVNLQAIYNYTGLTEKAANSLNELKNRVKGNKNELVILTKLERVIIELCSLSSEL